jgi:hypothetical protein
MRLVFRSFYTFKGSAKIPYTIAVTFSILIRMWEDIRNRKSTPRSQRCGKSPRLPYVTPCFKHLNEPSESTKHIPGLFFPKCLTTPCINDPQFGNYSHCCWESRSDYAYIGEFESKIEKTTAML